MGYQYNEAGGRTRTTWPDGYYVAYGFDALNRMSSATENGSVALASYTLDTLSRRTLLRMGGVASNQTGYTYENDSDLDVLTQTLNGTTVTLDHGHNRSHQLTGIAANDDFYLVRPATLTSRAYAPNALNEYGSFAGNAVTNDLNGNLTSWYPPDGSGKQTYTYDSENRLTSAAINGSSTATIFYDYDGLGRRVRKTVSGVATTYLLDGDEEIAEYNGSTLLRRYVTGPTIDDRIARAEGSGTSDPTKTYYHTNHQGSVIAITSPAGTVSQRLAYDEYGNLTSGAVTTGEQFRYTGRRFDAETGLYYYRARYYSPALGRFLQVDPIGYGDDINLYTYAQGDPPIDCLLIIAIMIVPSVAEHRHGTTCGFCGSDRSPASPGAALAGPGVLAQRRRSHERMRRQFGHALAGCSRAGWRQGAQGSPGAWAAARIEPGAATADHQATAEGRNGQWLWHRAVDDQSRSGTDSSVPPVPYKKDNRRADLKATASVLAREA